MIPKMGRGSPEMKAGTCISVFWDLDEEWYDGEILEFDPETRNCKVLYADGEREEFVLDSVEYKVLKEKDKMADEGISSKKQVAYIVRTLLDIEDRLPPAAVSNSNKKWWQLWHARVKKAQKSGRVSELLKLTLDVAFQIKDNVTTTWWKDQRMDWQKQVSAANTPGLLIPLLSDLLTKAVDWASARELFPPESSEDDEEDAYAPDNQESAPSTYVRRGVENRAEKGAKAFRSFHVQPDDDSSVKSMQNEVTDDHFFDRSMENEILHDHSSGRSKSEELMPDNLSVRGKGKEMMRDHSSARSMEREAVGDHSFSKESYDSLPRKMVSQSADSVRRSKRKLIIEDDEADYDRSPSAPDKLDANPFVTENSPLSTGKRRKRTAARRERQRGYGSGLDLRHGTSWANEMDRAPRATGVAMYKGRGTPPAEHQPVSEFALNPARNSPAKPVEKSRLKRSKLSLESSLGGGRQTTENRKGIEKRMRGSLRLELQSEGGEIFQYRVPEFTSRYRAKLKGGEPHSEHVAGASSVPRVSKLRSIERSKTFSVEKVRQTIVSQAARSWAAEQLLLSQPKRKRGRPRKIIDGGTGGIQISGNVNESGLEDREGAPNLAREKFIVLSDEDNEERSRHTARDACVMAKKIQLPERGHDEAHPIIVPDKTPVGKSKMSRRTKAAALLCARFERLRRRGRAKAARSKPLKSRTAQAECGPLAESISVASVGAKASNHLLDKRSFPAESPPMQLVAPPPTLLPVKANTSQPANASTGQPSMELESLVAPPPTLLPIKANTSQPANASTSQPSMELERIQLPESNIIDDAQAGVNQTLEIRPVQPEETTPIQPVDRGPIRISGAQKRKTGRPKKAPITNLEPLEHVAPGNRVTETCAGDKSLESLGLGGGVLQDSGSVVLEFDGDATSGRRALDSSAKEREGLGHSWSTSIQATLAVTPEKLASGHQLENRSAMSRTSANEQNQASPPSASDEERLGAKPPEVDKVANCERLIDVTGDKSISQKTALLSSVAEQTTENNLTKITISETQTQRDIEVHEAGEGTVDSGNSIEQGKHLRMQEVDLNAFLKEDVGRRGFVETEIRPSVETEHTRTESQSILEEGTLRDARRCGDISEAHSSGYSSSEDGDENLVDDEVADDENVWRQRFPSDDSESENELLSFAAGKPTYVPKHDLLSPRRGFIREAKPPCSICDFSGDGMSVLVCDENGCTCAAHTFCLNPPLKAFPDGEWLCPHCVHDKADGNTSKRRTKKCTSAMYPQKLITAIIGRRADLSKEQGSSTDKTKIDYLVKWGSLSHEHDTWIPEDWLLFMDEKRVSNFQRNHPLSSEINNINVDERRPEWLWVDRIIGCRRQDDKTPVCPSSLSSNMLIRKQDARRLEFLVKWQGLDHSNATWEVENDKEQTQKAISDYIKRHEDAETTGPWEEKKNVAPSMTQQPDYLCGGMIYGFQLRGLNWLLTKFEQGRSVILADEMGLGKTVQSVAFISCLRYEKLSSRPVLVISPKSGLPGWEQELRRWAPGLNVVVYGGEKENRKLIREYEFYTASGRPLFQVLLTSFEFATFDNFLPKKLKWASLIVDEGHRVRGVQAKLSTLLKRHNADFRLFLTGTPVQDSSPDLFTLLHFLDPVGFPDPEFVAHELADSDNECGRNQRDGNIVARQVLELREHLNLWILRRAKSEVLGDLIPGKKLVEVACALTNVQRQLYIDIIKKNKKVLNMGAKAGLRRSLHSVLTDLKMVCNHPLPASAADALQSVGTTFFTTNRQLNHCRYLFPGKRPQPLGPREAYETLVASSGKLQFLEKILPLLKAEGHKVLLFSQMKKMLDILEEFLVSVGLPHCRIDESTSGPVRQEYIDAFNTEHTLFVSLISTRAGGLGINLPSADTIIICDPDFNPFVDILAQARAHRAGQDKTVLVYQLVTKSSVEEKILQRARKKLAMEDLAMSVSTRESAADINIVLLHGARNILDECDQTATSVTFTDDKLKNLLDRNTALSESNAQQPHRQMNITPKNMSIEGHPDSQRAGPGAGIFSTSETRAVPCDASDEICIAPEGAQQGPHSAEAARVNANVALPHTSMGPLQQDTNTLITIPSREEVAYFSGPTASTNLLALSIDVGSTGGPAESRETAVEESSGPCSALLAYPSISSAPGPNVNSPISFPGLGTPRASYACLAVSDGSVNPLSSNDHSVKPSTSLMDHGDRQARPMDSDSHDLDGTSTKLQLAIRPWEPPTDEKTIPGNSKVVRDSEECVQPSVTCPRGDSEEAPRRLKVVRPGGDSRDEVVQSGGGSRESMQHSPPECFAVAQSQGGSRHCQILDRQVSKLSSSALELTFPRRADITRVCPIPLESKTVSMSSTSSSEAVLRHIAHVSDASIVKPRSTPLSIDTSHAFLSATPHTELEPPDRTILEPFVFTNLDSEVDTAGEPLSGPQSVHDISSPSASAANVVDTSFIIPGPSADQAGSRDSGPLKQRETSNTASTGSARIFPSVFSANDNLQGHISAPLRQTKKIARKSHLWKISLSKPAQPSEAEIREKEAAENLNTNVLRSSISNSGSQSSTDQCKSSCFIFGEQVGPVCTSSNTHERTSHVIGSLDSSPKPLRVRKPLWLPKGDAGLLMGHLQEQGQSTTPPWLVKELMKEEESSERGTLTRPTPSNSK